MTKPATRVDPPVSGDEKAILTAFLNYQRETFRWKATGLDPAQLTTPHPPSTLTLAGLTKHLALQEDWWLGVVLTGRDHVPPFAGVNFDDDPEWEFRTATSDPPADLLALWERTVAASDATVAGLDLDALSMAPSTSERFTLRWILLHLIEEYARHNGHADLVRESLDGLTGE